MKLYEANLEFFEQNLRFVYNSITLEKPIYDSEVELMDDTKNFIVENENKRCFAHSIFNIDRENIRMFNKVRRDAEKLIIFGIGCGHFIDYIHDNFKDLRNITIIEPDLNVFKVAMHYLDINKMIEKLGNITFIINKNKEEAFNILCDGIGDNFTEKIDFAYNISYRSLYSGYYESLNKNLVDFIRNSLINMSTQEMFLYQWANNIIRNIKYSSALLQDFILKFEDIPAILVAAGPSLNYNMHYLKQIGDRAVIMASGTAIKILESNGIKPHFRLALDGGENEWNVFKNIDTNSSTLIFADSLYHKIIEEYKGNKVRMFLNTDKLGQFFEKFIYKDDYTFESGFSIANVTLDVAIRLGFKKIIFLGQDLCFSEGNMYAKGSWAEGNKNKVCFDEKIHTKMKNVKEEEVITTKQFLGMKDSIENRIKRNPEIKYINATERGLNINGTVNESFNKVVKEELNESFDIEGTIQRILDERRSNDNYNVENIKNLMIQINDDIENLIRINEKRLKRLKKLKRYFEKNLGINKLNTEIDHVKDIENELEKIPFYKEVIKPMVFSKFKAIYMYHSYNGKDKKIIIDKNIKALLGQTITTKKFLEFLKDILKENIK